MPKSASPTGRASKLSGALLKLGRSWESALAALIAFSYLAFDARFLRDGDTYWHVAAGEWMLEQRAVPLADPFSFTFAGRDWHAHEWLSEVFFALAARGAGWSGVLLLTGLAGGITIGLVHLVARRNLAWPWAAAAALLALTCMAPNLLARPQVFGIALLAVWTKLLLDARAQDRTPALWTLLLIVVWANLHGTVLFGLALTAAFALEALSEHPAAWQRIIRQWALFGLGAGLAALLTPRGLEGVLFLVQLTRMDALAAIVEWMPPDFSKPTGLLLLLFSGLMALLFTGTKVPLVRLLLLLVMLYMTLNHQRHQVLLALVGTMIVCEALGAANGSRSVAGPRPHWPVLLLGLVAVGLAVVRLALPVSIADSERSPGAALAAVPAELRERPVLNAYGAGGFLIANKLRPFIDGRTDLYQDAFFKRFEAIVADRGGALDAALTEYGIAWTMLEVGSPAVAALDRKPGWQRIYSDRFVVVHRKLN